VPGIQNRSVGEGRGIGFLFNPDGDRKFRGGDVDSSGEAKGMLTTGPAAALPALSKPPDTQGRSGNLRSATVLSIQPREDLPDCPEVIRRVSGRGECGGSAHVVPIRAAGHDLSPFFGFVAQAIT
jgi:hypothetical protein